jgi:solute carrier family 25 carnitine/acylcarnitine transporter 20/29
MSKDEGFANEFLAGCVGGFAQVFIGQPFDIVKVRLQSAAAGTKPSAIGTFLNILRNEGGPKAFWRGSLPPLMGVGAAVSIQFGVNENVKKVLSKITGSEEFSFFQLFYCGVIAGLANAVVSVPSEHIRILMQTQNPKSPVYSGSVDCMKKIYGQYGFKGLYKGTNATLLREAISFGTYFSVYGWVIQKLAVPGQTRVELGIPKVALAGAIAGMILWPLCFPVDVIKTRLQLDSFTKPQYKNAMDCARQIYAKQGWRGFVNGLAPCFLRAGPTNGGTFVAYEMTYRWLTSEKAEQMKYV